MQPILDSIMQKMVQAEKITHTQKQLINSGYDFNTPNYKHLFITKMNTNDNDVTKNLMEALQLLGNEDITQPMSIKKIYTEANNKHTKFIRLLSKEKKDYGAPRSATIAYSKLIQLLATQ
ncbi:hypothetical protein [Borrelia puertoricensis]|uniref:hypothetical protein n=1 Tax=Borrelia puertoricensis TaxID=2756107 RepID=UPI001FF290A1|nr:hypothetical protein [Borrelia puertoricensis]UPA19031.1 hypothetical protein bpuSUM_001569 [Borrelia puertoricensis]